MTDLGDTSNVRSLVRSDGVLIENLSSSISATTLATEDVNRFWASGQRYISDPSREIMEVSFGSKQMINYISFEISNFPVVAHVEYLDDAGLWQSVAYEGAPRPTTVPIPVPVSLVISTSVPSKVNSASATTHPQHFGAHHWFPEAWKIAPITTSAIRFVLVRNHRGDPPQDYLGYRVPYSLAIKDLQLGYRVTSRDDIPTSVPDSPNWASTKDIIGSQVLMSTYEQSADLAIDGDTGTFWKSEPQPFPFAVVNMYLDVRDADGSIPVLDRFWVDPITVGVNCNVYHCDVDPTGGFSGLSSPIPSHYLTMIGNPVVVREASAHTPTGIALGPDLQAGIEVSNSFIQIPYDQPWWVGVDARALIDGLDLGNRPILSIGSTQIRQNNGVIEVITQSGDVASIDLDPNLHRVNGEYRIVVSYQPRLDQASLPSHLRLIYQIPGYDPISAETIADIVNESLPVRVGLATDPGDTSVAAIDVLGLVVKSEYLTPETEDWFLQDGADYVKDPANVQVDLGTSRNALIRMHPSFLSAVNPAAIVGGAEGNFEEMVWTPILGDYSLKQGFMHLAPTKSRYWKFEMTSLLPQIYENFLTIEREVIVFPADVVALHDATYGENSSNVTPSGVATNSYASQAVAYSDVLNNLKSNYVSSDATSVLVISDPVQAAEIAKAGWIWNYMPWHGANSAPQFIGACQHKYESFRISHTTKVAFFAGLREITPFRANYNFEDDTPEYVEHFLDDQFIEPPIGMEYLPEGGLRSTGSQGSVESNSLLSYDTIRGVQFATQETDVIQVLRDPDFSLTSLSEWSRYGDAVVDLVGRNDVKISRGWFYYTYYALISMYPSYSEMDGVRYDMLEGSQTATAGSSDGGITSAAYTPMGTGRISAKVKVSSEAQLSTPIWVEIVSVTTGQVVASTQRTLHTGESANVSVGYTPKTLVKRWTYNDLSAFAYTKSFNLFLEDTSSFELGTGGWSAGFNSTISTSTDQAYNGTHSLYLKATATSTNATMRSSSVPVTAGLTYAASAYVLPAITSRNVQMTCVWIDNQGTIISSVDSAVVTEGAYWVALNTNAVAPAGAVGAYLSVKVISPAANEIHYLDAPVFTLSVPGGNQTMITYAGLESYTYAALEAQEVPTEFYIRIRQKGYFRDTFHIHRVGLYDSPVAWSFSNDGGVSWWQAVDVRNDPYAVLIFPDNPDEVGITVGRTLKWRAQIFRADASINSLYIRPWYGSRSRTTEPYFGLDSLGPNKSVSVAYPPLGLHPAWFNRNNSIENVYDESTLANVKTKHNPINDPILGDGLIYPDAGQ